MKELNKVRLLQEVTKKLRREMRTFAKVNSFLTDIGVPETRKAGVSYDASGDLDTRLTGISNNELIRIAQDELDMDISHLTSQPTKPAPPKPTKPAPPKPAKLAPPKPAKPKNDKSLVKAFISHSTKNKIYANAIRKIFKKYGIEAFVSGKDIKGGQKWRKKIRKEINEMEIFIAIHTQAFSESLWCQQEAGLALARENDIEIIPINSNKGKAPESFLDDFQYIERKSKTTETVVREIFETLRESEKTNKLYFAKIEPKVKQVDEDAKKAIDEARLESINRIIKTVDKITEDLKKDRHHE